MNDKKSKSKFKEKSNKRPKETKSKSPKKTTKSPKNPSTRAPKNKNPKRTISTNPKSLNPPKTSPRKISHSSNPSSSTLLPPLTNRTPFLILSICPYHNEKNTNFCEVCEQVGCESCLVYGPHNNQMHRISKLD